MGLINVIPQNEKEDFDFTFNDLDPIEFMRNSFMGGHKYLMRTDFSQIPAAARRVKR